MKGALRFLILIHIFFVICGTAAVAKAYDQTTATWFFLGGLLMLVNLGTHVFVWPRILAKKLIALSVGVIVFKFAILGWIIYEAATGSRLSLLLGLNPDSFSLPAFAGGLGLVVPTVFATALRVSMKISDQQDSSNAPKTAVENLPNGR